MNTKVVNMVSEQAWISNEIPFQKFFFTIFLFVRGKFIDNTRKLPSRLFYNPLLTQEKWVVNLNELAIIQTDQCCLRRTLRQNFRTFSHYARAQPGRQLTLAPSIQMFWIFVIRWFRNPRLVQKSRFFFINLIGLAKCPRLSVENSKPTPPSNLQKSNPGCALATIALFTRIFKSQSMWDLVIEAKKKTN